MLDQRIPQVFTLILILFYLMNVPKKRGYVYFDIPSFCIESRTDDVMKLR